MWKLEIVKSNKNEVIGCDLDTHTQHSIDTAKLFRKPKKGEVVSGYKAGGCIIAEKFETEVTK